VICPSQEREKKKEKVFHSTSENFSQGEKREGSKLGRKEGEG